MNSLKKTIEFDIFTAFEDKIQDADIPERVRDSLYESINNLIEDVKDLIDNTNCEIDGTIEDYSKENIERIKDDIRTQDYIERELV